MGTFHILAWAAFHASVFYGTMTAFSSDGRRISRAVASSAAAFVHGSVVFVVAPWVIAGSALDFASPNTVQQAVLLSFCRAFFATHSMLYAFHEWRSDPMALIGNITSLTMIAAASTRAGGPVLALLYVNALSDAVGAFSRFVEYTGCSYRLVDNSKVAHALVFVLTRSVFLPIIAVNFFAAGVGYTDAPLKDRIYWALAPITATISVPFVACKLFDEARIF
jgi:hypothetical protein